VPLLVVRTRMAVEVSAGERVVGAGALAGGRLRAGSRWVAAPAGAVRRPVEQAAEAVRAAVRAPRVAGQERVGERERARARVAAGSVAVRA
jgi:hypothetical protein